MKFSFTFIALVCLLSLFFTTAHALKDDPVPETIDEHAYGTFAVDGTFAFAGVFNSKEAKSKQTLVVNLTPKVTPEDVTVEPVAITFRRWPCNCFVQEFQITEFSKDLILTFTQPIDDDAMSFQAMATYTGDIKDTINYSLVIKATEEATELHTLEFDIEPRQSFAQVLSFSGARQTVIGHEDPAVRFDLLLSALNWERMVGTYPPTMLFTAVGRFQFPIEKDQKKSVRCYINNIGIPGEIAGVSEFHTTLRLDLLQYPVIGKIEFQSIHCDESAALIATNALDAFKYDISFLNFEFLDVANKPTGLGQYAAFKNFPDVYPTTFSTAGFVDNDVLYCKYSVNFGPGKEINEKQLSDSKGKLSVFFSGITNVATPKPVDFRMDITPNKYYEDSALSMPLVESFTAIANATINALVAEDIDIKAQRFYNITSGLSFSTFIDLTETNADTKDVQCAGILTHDNNNSDWPGVSKYTTATSVTSYKPFATSLLVDAVLVKEKATFELILDKILIDAALAPVTQIVVNVDLMQNWIISGDITQCNVYSVAAKDTKHIVAVKATIPKDRETGATLLTFVIDETVQPLFAQDASIGIECQGAKFVSRNPQYEFGHESTLVQIKITTQAEDRLPTVYSNTNILELKPNQKYVKIVFIAFSVIMAISAIGMLICMARCAFATCKHKKEQGNITDDSLLLNSTADSYTLA